MHKKEKQMIELGTYPGGKGVVFRNIINEMPPHKTYVEAFVGGGAVALNKRPAERNILIDLDAEVIAAWLGHLVRNGGAAAPPDSTMGAAIATCGDTSGYLVIAADATRWELYRADALRLLPLLRLGKDALVYADPPYLFDVRLSDRYMYRHELGLPEQHTALIGNLDQLNCKVMISGYWSGLYAGLLTDGWRSYSFKSRDRGGNIREEYVWCNFPEPARLHDYSFLGDNFRERERIKRKAARWANRFQNLPTLERRAILEQLDAAGVLD
jgi:DNA adenine methylase